MDQAKSFVCKSCSTPVPPGHKFCGRCGASVPPEVAAMQTQYFGALQTPGRAKVVLVRYKNAGGDALVEGTSFQLNAEQHIIGRSGHLVLSSDLFVAPRHANLLYREGKLVARDESENNGIYWRAREPVVLASGSTLLVGDQLLRLDVEKPDGVYQDTEGTSFYGSPHTPITFRVTQLLACGGDGFSAVSRGDSMVIGREGADLVFLDDCYLNPHHCRVELVDGQFRVTDLGSMNGTYVRVAGEKELTHGDYIFVGQSLLRVEITS